MLSQVKRLLQEGKGNKAIVNHFTVVNDNLTEFQVRASCFDQPSFKSMVPLLTTLVPR